MTDVKKK